MDANDYTVVYHGSDCIVQNPDINKYKGGKDFGKGFYITTDEKQAMRFAKIVARRNGKTKGYVNIYKMYNARRVAIFSFKSTTAEWLECIVGNRDKRYANLKVKWDVYDIITGKIADDDTSQVINAYMSGAYGETGSKEATSIAIKMLKPERLKNQICFKTLKALSFIKFETYYEVDL